MTKRINDLRQTPAASVWQRNYYEHVRSDGELLRVREYIVNNPLEWKYDRENPSRPADLKPARVIEAWQVRGGFETRPGFLTDDCDVSIGALGIIAIIDGLAWATGRSPMHSGSPRCVGCTADEGQSDRVAFTPPGILNLRQWRLQSQPQLLQCHSARPSHSSRSA